MAAGQTNKWLGGDSGNETDANTAANWSLGTIPVDGENIVFDDEANEDSAGRKYDCVWDNYADVLRCQGFKVDDTFDGDIGDSTNPLELALEYSGDLYTLTYEGQGNCYILLKDDNDVGTDMACEKLVVNCTGGLWIYSDDGAGTRNNDWGNIYAYAGTLVVADSSVFAMLFAMGNCSVTVGKTCRTSANGDIPVLMIGGTVVWDSELGSDNKIYGGSFYWGSEANAGDVAALECDLVEIVGAGQFFWRVFATGGGTSILKQFKAYSGGLMDASSAIGAGGAKELGTGSEVSELWYGSTAKFNNGVGNITVDAGSSIYNYGGNLYLPDGENVSW